MRRASLVVGSKKAAMAMMLLTASRAWVVDQPSDCQTPAASKPSGRAGLTAYWYMTGCAAGCAWDSVDDGRRQKLRAAGVSMKKWQARASWRRSRAAETMMALEGSGCGEVLPVDAVSAAVAVAVGRVRVCVSV